MALNIFIDNDNVFKNRVLPSAGRLVVLLILGDI